jgi:hypothetical protein
MLKLKHIRHPFHTLSVAKELLADHLSMKVLGPRGNAQFMGDPRFSLQNVAHGFAPRVDECGDDAAILQRICSAFALATNKEAMVNSVYAPTAWWEDMRRHSLAPVRRALAMRDIGALQSMYRNFFRDSCSNGLVGAPYKMSKESLGQEVDESYLQYFLSNALYRIDHWKAQTGNRFNLNDLLGPEIGNPFGVSIDGTLVRTGTEAHHYSAQRIIEILPPRSATVVEIGGGFGGMAHYLLRDRPGTMYVNFDVPESIALASYYLLKSFPDREFLLYGERPLSTDSLLRFPIVLMPSFELANMPTESADLTFSAHTMSSLTRAAATEYLHQVNRMTRKYLLFVGRREENRPLEKLMRLQHGHLALVEKRLLEWNKLKTFKGLDEECLYQLRS